MSDKTKPKRVPVFSSDEEAEAFLEQDLSELDFSQFKPVRFEFAPKTERVNMRLPAPLLEGVKARAAQAGMPYQRYIRLALEEALARPAATKAAQKTQKKSAPKPVRKAG
jgi:predicted DNA binding CopG/RHH family protein